MPRKIILENETDPVKPKREITDAQREHLNKIRLLAMAKKTELKEITLKSKLAKTVPKKELAEQYDNYVAQKAVQSVNPKPKAETKFTAESEDEDLFGTSTPEPKAKAAPKAPTAATAADDEDLDSFLDGLGI